MRRYTICVQGLDSETFTAPNAGAAKAMAFRQLEELGYFKGRDRFRRFLECLEAVHARGPVPERCPLTLELPL